MATVREEYNTGLTREQIANAFSRALNDMTDAQINALLAQKQNTLTFDNSPTSGSSNPVKSDGVFTALSGKAAVSDLTAETNARIAADNKHDAVLASLLNGESKNLLDLSNISGATINGITWVVDADNGIITANGTASANSFFYIWGSNSNIPIGYDTELVGAPSGGSTTTYELQAAISSTVYHDYGSGVEIPAGTIRYVTCCVRSGSTVNNLEFHPMLCASAAYGISPDPVPYHPPIADMWSAIRALQSGTRLSTQNLLASSQPTLVGATPEVENGGDAI